MCAQRRLRSACAYAQSDQSLRCPPEDALDHWQPRLYFAKTLISLIWVFAGRTCNNLGGNDVRRLKFLIFRNDIAEFHLLSAQNLRKGLNSTEQCASYDIHNINGNNMNLIGATYICASKISSHASKVGWPDLTEFDFRPRLTSNPVHELR